MRSAQEIIARIERLSESDIFGIVEGDLVPALPYEDALPYLRVDVTKEQWDAEENGGVGADYARRAIEQYMPFAWDKANNCHVLSAARSMMHMQNWVWLLGVDLDINTFQYYGKPVLRGICEALGLDWRQWDDGRWRNGESDPPVEPLPGVEIRLPEVTV